MQLLKLWFLLFWTWLISANGWSEEATRTENALDGHLLWGDCALNRDPTSRNSPWPVACVKLDASSDLFINLTDTNENLFGLFAEGYLGLHLFPWLSWHLVAKREKLHFLTPNETQLPDNSIVESSYLQFGNPALHHIRVLAGRVPLPYGIDFDVLPKIFRLRVRDLQYWKYPIYSVRLTYDNLLDTIAEFGVGSDKIPDDLRNSLNIERYSESSETASGEKSVSARLSHDISALGGTKITAFHLRSDNTDTRYGAAVINETRRDTATSFEWQRRYLRDSDKKLQQLFRVVYWGPFDRGQRTIVEYEDNRSLYWMFTFGQEYRLFDHRNIRLNLGYYRRESGRLMSHFFLNTGLEVKF